MVDNKIKSFILYQEPLSRKTNSKQAYNWDMNVANSLCFVWMEDGKPTSKPITRLSLPFDLGTHFIACGQICYDEI